MKNVMTIMSLVILSSTAFAATDAELEAFKTALRKDLAIGTALFDCLDGGKQISEIYEKAGLVYSSNETCQSSMKAAIALGATEEDFLKALDSRTQK